MVWRVEQNLVHWTIDLEFVDPQLSHTKVKQVIHFDVPVFTKPCKSLLAKAVNFGQ